MIIKVFNPIPQDGVFKCIDVLTQAKSVIWNKRFYRAGSFQISLSTRRLKVGDLILHGENSGIITKAVETYNGANYYGQDLKGIFAQRYIYDELTLNDTKEKILHTLATDLLMTGVRAVSGLSVIENQSAQGEAVEFTTKGENAESAISKFCTENEIGYDISFSEENGMIFKTIYGTDKSNLLFFSREHRNMDSLEYTSDISSEVNYVKPEEETEEQTASSDASEYTGILRREGKEISEAVETLRGSANNLYKYGVDYRLGDYVSVGFKEFSAKKQITEIEFVYEPNNNQVIPIFGTENENPIIKILKGRN